MFTIILILWHKQLGSNWRKNRRVFDDKLLVQNMNKYFYIGTLKNVLCKKININQLTNFKKQWPCRTPGGIFIFKGPKQTEKIAKESNRKASISYPPFMHIPWQQCLLRFSIIVKNWRLSHIIGWTVLMKKVLIFKVIVTFAIEPPKNQRSAHVECGQWKRY